MSSNLSITTAFASPIIAFAMPNALPLNRDLKTLFLAREAQGDRWRKKIATRTVQTAIFESEFDLFAWPDPPVQHLRGFCLSKLGEVIAELNGYDAEQMRRWKLHVDSWFHVTRRGGYIGAHTHPMCSWSGVYCVAAGERPPQFPDSGVLRFPDARPYANMFQDPGNVNLRSPYGSGALNYRLDPGHLLLFPSYLVHEVTPFEGRDERITVAFNVALGDPSTTTT